MAATGSTVFPFGYIGVDGYYTDIASLLIQVRARYLWPLIGAWLSSDPLWAPLSEVSRRYAGNSPTNATDPSGMVVPAAAYAAIKAFLIAEAACILAAGYVGLNKHNNNKHRADWSDKTAHCYTCCIISRTCGRIPSWMTGYLWEMGNEIQEWIGALPQGFDWADILANQEGRDCSGWETLIFCGNLGRWFRDSCEKCCVDKNL